MIVLPERTSPWISRFMTEPLLKSLRTSSSVLSWAFVSLYGRSARSFRIHPAFPHGMGSARSDVFPLNGAQPEEEEELVIHEPLSRKLQFFLVRRKVDVLDRKIILRKFVGDPEAGRKIIPLQRAERECLLDCGSDRLISRPFVWA